jgi:crotonobetainyl-CoA:carnitine CoA-transferase CaiB-like acyl-CoA transferase
VSGKTLLTGLPFAFLPTKPQSFGATPRLGENTEETLSGWLNLPTPEISDLRAKGILV